MSVDAENDSLTNTTFGYSRGIDIDSQKNIYVADTDYDVIRFYNMSNSTWSTILGSGGTGIDQYKDVTDIKVKNNKIYTVDDLLHRVQIYDTQTSMWTSFGSQGSGSNQLKSPMGLAVNDQGDLYVADSGNDRVQIYNIGTSTWSSIGTSGTGLGQFSWPWGIAVDAENNVYVTDIDNNNLQKYNSNTHSWSVIAVGGTGINQLENPTDVDIGQDGKIYIYDLSSTGYIKIFDPVENTWTGIGTRGDGLGQFIFSDKAAIDSQGNIYTVNAYSRRVQIYNPTTNTWLTSGKQGEDPGELNFPQGMSVDTNGNIYVADTRNQRIQIYNVGSSSWSTMGSSIFGHTAGWGLGYFSDPYGIDTDADGNIYVADSQNHRIQKYNIGTSTWTSFQNDFYQGTEVGDLNYPKDVVIGPNGNIYIADSNNHRIAIYSAGSSTWSSLGTEGYPSTTPGKFGVIWGIDVADNGDIYVADTWNNRIQIYDVSAGTWLAMGGVEGSELGQFDWPEGIDVDSSGNIYVADTDNHRIQKYNVGTSTWSAIGNEGEGLGQFKKPTKVRVDSSGNIYVLEKGNHRIQKLIPLPLYSVKYTAQENGSIQGDTTQSVFHGHDSTSVVAVGNSGYAFLEWSDESTENPRIDVGVTGNINVSAAFTNTKTISNPNTNVLRREIQSGAITTDGDNPTNGQNYIFNINYTFQTGNASVVIPAETTATKTDGGAFNLTSWVTIDQTNETQDSLANSLAALKVGVPNINLTFSQPITITVPVSSSYEGKTLDIYTQQEGSSDWTKETTCLVINSNCTFQTNHATIFGVVNKPQTQTNNSVPVFYYIPDHSCHSSRPQSISDLFQIDASATKAKIFFTPQSDTNDYFVSFSSKNKNAEEHGERVTLLREGVQSHTIYSLKPNTIYYVKVRGQNGCMPGGWSTIMKFKTAPKKSKKIIKYYKYLKLFKLSKWVMQ